MATYCSILDIRAIAFADGIHRFTVRKFTHRYGASANTEVAAGLNFMIVVRQFALAFQHGVQHFAGAFGRKGCSRRGFVASPFDCLRSADFKNALS